MTNSIYQPTPEWQAFKKRHVARAMAKNHLKLKIEHAGRALMYGISFFVWYAALCVLLA